MNTPNILIEHLPRLQCANFFLLFKNPFADNASVNVHLKSNCIIAYFDGDASKKITIELQSVGLQIQINSLSLLIVKKNLVSFRVNTSKEFYNEILPVGPSVDALNNYSSPKLELNVRPNDKLKIICDNCSAVLSDLLSFRRLLELPSENMDQSDWFCHKHPPPNSQTKSSSDDHSCHYQTKERCETSNNFSDHLQDECDLLYGNFYILLNLDVFKHILFDDQKKVVHCRRCLKHLGEYQRDKTVKLWDNNVKVKLSTKEENTSMSFFRSQSLFKNFIFILEKVLSDFQALGYQMQKLLFNAKHLDGSTRYLFIQIVTKKLELFRTKKTNVDENIISLRHISGLKCLFRSETNSDQALLRFWQNDINVSGGQISIEMFDCVVEQLLKYSEFVPERFRENNGFYLSYVIDE